MTNVIYWELKELICRSGQQDCNLGSLRLSNRRKHSSISSEMKTILLTVLCYTGFIFAQSFEIARLSHGRDKFNIPTSICGQNGPASGFGCKSFYAVDGARSCSCLCPAGNSTFAFYNREWSCIENRALRKHLYQGNLLEGGDVWARSSKKFL